VEKDASNSSFYWLSDNVVLYACPFILKALMDLLPTSMTPCRKNFSALNESYHIEQSIP